MACALEPINPYSHSVLHYRYMRFVSIKVQQQSLMGEITG